MESESLIKEKRGRNKSWDYGSVGYSSADQRLTTFDHVAYSRLDDDQQRLHIKFVFRKRDAIIVAVLLLLVIVSILTTLLIGIPAISAKTKLNNTWLLPDHSLPVVYPEKSDVGVFRSVAVSTNCPQCSTIASRVLARNGSAIDAAIAATLCLSVVDLHHTGLAGGFLMTSYHRQGRRVEVIDARESAPAAAQQLMFQRNPLLSSIGGLSVAVPGVLRGLGLAHQLYGRLNWSELVWPSIQLCEQGFQVGTSLALALQEEKLIIRNTNLRWLLLDERSGEVWKKGDVIKQPTLGRTLRVLAKRGPEEFYSGQMAADFVNDVQSQNGVMTLSDLSAYRAELREAVRVGVGGVQVYSVPPPGSGALLAFFLNLVEGFNTSLTAHRIAEAMKMMYGRRGLLADPHYVEMQPVVEQLLDKTYAASVRSLIRDDATLPDDYYVVEGGGTGEEDRGTSHVSIVAANGDAVAVTSTINQKFGARVLSPSTGLILNDEMDDFSSGNSSNYFGVAASRANVVEGGKRPVSSMCPSIVLDEAGDVLVVSGAAGGLRITSSTAYTILRHLWMNESLAEATDQPRMHYQFPNQNVLEIESGIEQEVVSSLESLGHRVKVVDRSPTIVNSVGIPRGGGPRGAGLVAVADRRGDARVDGF